MWKKPAASTVTREQSPTKIRSKSPTKTKDKKLVKNESSNLLLPNGEDNSEAEASSTKDSGYDETEAVPTKVRASASPDTKRSRSKKSIEASKQTNGSPKKLQNPIVAVTRSKSPPKEVNKHQGYKTIFSQEIRQREKQI